MTIWLSEELKAVRDQLMMVASAGRSLGPMEIRSIVQNLTALVELAEVDEHELRVFRLDQAGKQGRSIVEQLAGEAMGNMMLDGEKIVRPNFGRKS
ncbi:hypothetical protein [Gellertiella hungarica]|uniref:Uncharacterized protein n=1 Tax=Gellertiella hungarica TaxID=1572859 RepID=A0A7W6NM46_9HYPH|nr:hypothetical protein [Gellertiella hungarica]MBB4066249.1 hypothetical protein [Gellertiella hungarica]